jgi:hypothetical protein
VPPHDSDPARAVCASRARSWQNKAQWLTWVAFDHFWHNGKIWRCSRQPLHVDGRPPYTVRDHVRWLDDVALIQQDPRRFYDREGRVCIRWDLESSPWLCCPQSTSVRYGWFDGTLHAFKVPPRNSTAELRNRLALLPQKAGVVMRMASYDVCMEGAFFHAGLHPTGERRAPSCSSGTWALLDEAPGPLGTGRFSGTLRVLHEECSIVHSQRSSETDGALVAGVG